MLFSNMRGGCVDLDEWLMHREQVVCDTFHSCYVNLRAAVLHVRISTDLSFSIALLLIILFLFRQLWEQLQVKFMNLFLVGVL